MTPTDRFVELVAYVSDTPVVLAAVAVVAIICAYVAIVDHTKTAKHRRQR